MSSNLFPRGGFGLPARVDAHLLAVVPVPFRHLVKGHADLLSDPQLVLVGPLVALFKLLH